MLVSLGVENFRSFKKKTDIKLKPITVFVGRNSCGKSSFLRLFPLFRQSIEAHTTGPVLWFGRYVDFGDFNNVLFKDAKEKEITFYFTIKFFPSIRGYDDFFNKKKEKKLTDVKVELTIEPDKQKTKYKSLRISSDTFNISLKQPSYNTIILSIIDSNNKEKLEFNEVSIEKSSLSYLLPTIQFKNSLSKEIEGPFKSENIDKEILFLLNSLNHERFYNFHDEFYNYLLHRTHESLISNKNISKTNENEDKLHNNLKKVSKNEMISFENLDKMYPTVYKTITKRLSLSKLNQLLQEIDNNLNNTFSNIRYIAPIRAIAERFYRFQDLQVNEMDHTGSNMAMLLNSLNETDKKLFGGWVKKNFNFSVAVEESGSHYAINIIDENGIKYNISDMGFGYSQLLPIIMSLWLETQQKETKNNQRNNDLFFVIEQPELHLHPAYQAQLAKLFSKIITKASRYNIKIIVETHSQYFINALGESVEQKQISKDEISIVVFNKKDKETEIQEAYFDEEGTLENWPIGFFSGE